MRKENTLKATKWLGVIVALAAVAFFAFRVLDAMMAWQLYSWFFQPLAESGVPEALSGAVAVWLMAAVMLVLPAFLYSLVTNRRKALVITATAVSAWFVIAYLISLPREGQFFNPITGRAMYRYSETDGKIKLLPLGYRYDPATGEALKDLTPEVAKRYTGQEEQSTGMRVASRHSVEAGVQYRYYREYMVGSRGEVMIPLPPDNWFEIQPSRPIIIRTADNREIIQTSSWERFWKNPDGTRGRPAYAIPGSQIFVRAEGPKESVFLVRISIDPNRPRQVR